MLKPYPHQQRIIDENPKKKLLVWEMRCGKTLPATIWVDKPERNQNAYIVCLKGNKKEWLRYKTKATVLTKEEFKKAKIINPSAIVIDECFVAGTKVLTVHGYKNIEDINIGDKVINAIGIGEVTNTNCQIKRELLKITFSNSNTTEVTPNHPFFTTAGWVKASDLNKNDELLHYFDVHDIFNTYDRMCTVQKNNNPTKRDISKENLFRILSSETFINEDDNQKPYVKKRGSSKNERNFKENGFETKNKGWEWSRDASSSKGFIVSTWQWLVCRTFCTNIFKTYKNWLSNMLQNRYSKPKKNDSNRGRWKFPQFIREENTRQEERGFSDTIRVESVEIQEFGSYEVFNISVNGHPSYVVNDVVVHNCHYFGSPVFLRKRSQLSEALYKLVKQYPEMDVLLLTATPIRQDAWSLHSLLCYIGVYYDWKVWREAFFELKTMPYMRFPAWFPKRDWRENLLPIRDKHCDIVSLHDIIKDLPQPEEKVIKIKNKFEKKDRWTDEHKDEQKGKLEIIQELGYKKLILVAHYTEQIDFLKDNLKDKPIYVLDGRTKDADDVKTKAQEADECYFIVQSSMGFGFNGYMFGAIVFVSMMHSIVEYIQMTGRQRHLEHIITPQHIHLIGGKWDKRIYDSIKNNENFNPHKYEKEH